MQPPLPVPPVVLVEAAAMLAPLLQVLRGVVPAVPHPRSPAGRAVYNLPLPGLAVAAGARGASTGAAGTYRQRCAHIAGSQPGQALRLLPAAQPFCCGLGRPRAHLHWAEQAGPCLSQHLHPHWGVQLPRLTHLLRHVHPHHCGQRARRGALLHRRWRQPAQRRQPAAQRAGLSALRWWQPHALTLTGWVGCGRRRVTQGGGRRAAGGQWRQPRPRRAGHCAGGGAAVVHHGAVGGDLDGHAGSGAVAGRCARRWFVGLRERSAGLEMAGTLTAVEAEIPAFILLVGALRPDSENGRLLFFMEGWPSIQLHAATFGRFIYRALLMCWTGPPATLHPSLLYTLQNPVLKRCDILLLQMCYQHLALCWQTGLGSWGAGAAWRWWPSPTLQPREGAWLGR
jgi:hypothetical protein